MLLTELHQNKADARHKQDESRVQMTEVPVKNKVAFLVVSALKVSLNEQGFFGLSN